MNGGCRLEVKNGIGNRALQVCVASRLGWLCRNRKQGDWRTPVCGCRARVGDLFTLSLKRTAASQWETGSEGEDEQAEAELTVMAGPKHVRQRPVSFCGQRHQKPKQSTAEIPIQVPKWDCGVSTFTSIPCSSPTFTVPRRARVSAGAANNSCRCHVTRSPVQRSAP